jgi:hypothetical protein
VTRRFFAGKEIRAAASAYIRGRDTDCATHLERALAALQGHGRGLP